MKNYDESRKLLKENGWKRRDLGNTELWIPPNWTSAYEPIGVSYITAMKRLEKELNKKEEN